MGKRRVVVTVWGDNMSAVWMLAKLQPKSKALGVIAREVAIDLSCASYAPDFTEHLPGVTNVTADALSRRFQPGKSYPTPPLLADAAEMQPPERVITWWKTLHQT